MSNVSWVSSGGPLASFADGYGAELARLGFTRHSVVTHMVLMGQLSRWMSDTGIVAGDLTEDRVQGFFDARRAGGQNRVPTASGTLVLPAPVDYVAWLERVGAAAARPDLQAPEKVLFVSGRLTPTAQKELSKRGWKIFEAFTTAAAQ